MGRAARLTSIDAVEAMRIALERFAEDAAAALTDLDLELRRAMDWVQHDRKRFWEQEVRQGWDRVAKAREELQRRRVLHKVADHEPGCREEKKALEQAKRRLQVAQEKVEAVRRWSHAVEKEAHEYRGSVNQLAGWLQGELPRAVAVLHRMTGALDSYVRLQSTVESLEPEALAPAARTAQPEPPQQPAPPDAVPTQAEPEAPPEPVLGETPEES